MNQPESGTKSALLDAQKCATTERNILRLLTEYVDNSSGVVVEVQHLKYCNGKYAELISTYKNEYNNYRNAASTSNQSKSLPAWEKLEYSTDGDSYKVKTNIARHYTEYTVKEIFKGNPQLQRDREYETYKPFVVTALVGVAASWIPSTLSLCRSMVSGAWHQFRTRQPSMNPFTSWLRRHPQNSTKPK